MVSVFEKQVIIDVKAKSIYDKCLYVIMSFKKQEARRINDFLKGLSS